GQRAGAGGEEPAGDAPQIAGVEGPVAREGGIAEGVPPCVNLQRPRAVLQLQKSGFAEVAERHHAAGDPDPRGGRERGVVEPAEAGVHLTGALVRAEIIRIGGRPLLTQVGELPPPDHDLLVVVRHASYDRKSRGVTGCRGGGQGTSALPASTSNSVDRALAPTR